MPTTIYDSSLITQRRRDKTVSGSFINRIQNPINPTTGSAPLLGISEQSIINTVKNGQMTNYRKNDSGCTTVNLGCPCAIPVSNVVTQLTQTGWATNIVNELNDQRSNNLIIASTTDIFGNVYVIGQYDIAPLIVNNFVSANGGAISTIPYGTLANTGIGNLYIVKYNTNGQAQWATNITGSIAIQGFGISTDTLGNVYITGTDRLPIAINSFSSVNTGTITTTPYGTLSNGGNEDTFIVKYNTNGQAQWATNVTGSNNETGIGITSDTSGNVYVIGKYRGLTTIKSFTSVIGGTITTTAYGTLNNTTIDPFGFIIKYNTDGQAQWATNVTKFRNDIKCGISTDTSGNLYIAGDYNTTSVTINSFASVSSGSIITTPYGTLANGGNTDTFIVKYNKDGQAQWATNITGSGNAYGTGLSIDTSGNIYVTGAYISSTIINSFSSVSGGTIITSSYGTLANGGDIDTFIVKYNKDGQAQWATNVIGSDYESGLGISNDSSGNVYVSGAYISSPLRVNSFASVNAGSITTTAYGTLSNTGGLNMFIIKYNTNGQVQWATIITSSGIVLGLGISNDASGNVYVSGLYDSAITVNKFVSVNSGAIITSSYGTLPINGNFNTFIVKYNTNGSI